MNKTFFILPGFKMQTKDKAYVWLINYLKSKKFKVIGVPVKWARNTLTQNAEDFKNFFNKNKGEVNYVLGFSYGAVINLLTASELKPNKIFLCSLSPDFKEDNKEMKDWIKNYLGKNRIKDIQTRSGRKLAKELSIPSIVFYGEKEGKQYPNLKNRCEETVKLARNSRLVIVKNAPHKINYPSYIEAIKENIN